MNRSRFKQLLQNLIHNAIQHNDMDNLCIEIGVVDKEGEYEFYVKDNGKGIAPSLHKIFKIFTKLESNNISSGIGLSIVKG
jgi:signal transduction histidine kinase